MPSNARQPGHKNLKAEIDFSLPDGRVLSLHRYPEYAKEQLRAWDAADEYLLRHIHDNASAQDGSFIKDSPILIVNDSFGALTLALGKQIADTNIVVVSDSYSARQAVIANAAKNALDLGRVQFHSSLDLGNLSARFAESDPEPAGENNKKPAGENNKKPAGENNKKPVGENNPKIDLVLIKVPKSLAHLQWQLSQIRHCLSDTATVIAAGMVKSIHSSTLKIFEDSLGQTRTSLAKKKARLIFSEIEHRDIQKNKGETQKLTVRADETACRQMISLISYPGVFAHGKLDIGTRFLLEHLHIPKGRINILDLGCGSGALGIAAALINKDAEVTFVDDSYLAIESAKLSVQESLPSDRQGAMHFLSTHSMLGVQENSQDVILINPPFHDAAARTSNIAMDMFRDSRRVLRPGGQLIVIANRHLGYHVLLKKYFGNCETLIGNKKFVILRAVFA